MMPLADDAWSSSLSFSAYRAFTGECNGSFGLFPFPFVVRADVVPASDAAAPDSVSDPDDDASPSGDAASHPAPLHSTRLSPATPDVSFTASDAPSSPSDPLYSLSLRDASSSSDLLLSPMSPDASRTPSAAVLEQRVIDEIIASEHAYVRSLGIVIEGYKARLEAINTTLGPQEKINIGLLFSNIDELAAFHEVFVKEIEAAGAEGAGALCQRFLDNVRGGKRGRKKEWAEEG